MEVVAQAIVQCHPEQIVRECLRGPDRGCRFKLGAERLYDLVYRTSNCHDGYTALDWDFEMPEKPIEAGADEGQILFERYEYPGFFGDQADDAYLRAKKEKHLCDYWYRHLNMNGVIAYALRPGRGKNGIQLRGRVAQILPPAFIVFRRIEIA